MDKRKVKVEDRSPFPGSYQAVRVMTDKKRHADAAMRMERKDMKFHTNPFAQKYKAKNEARTKALEEKGDSDSAKSAMKGIHKSLKRK